MGRKKPEWLKIKLPAGDNYLKVKDTLNKHGVNTICTSGKCPNLAECWGLGTATFMILGDICTRSCKFCATQTGKPKQVDINEPKKIARSVKALKLKHCVITSVDRDDLPDGGASTWVETIKEVKKVNPGITLEVLIPDFNADSKSLDLIINENPEIISHNLETVRSLTREIRSKASYEKSLKVINYISRYGIKCKSGIMVGMGETEEEIYDAMHDLFKNGCEIFTIGQYLQPTKSHWPVNRYVNPEEFERYKLKGLEIGFKIVESGPLVRSSYHAGKHV